MLYNIYKELPISVLMMMYHMLYKQQCELSRSATDLSKLSLLWLRSW